MSEPKLENILFEIEDLIKSMPPLARLGDESAEILAWLGRASAAIHAWNEPKGLLKFDPLISRLSTPMSLDLATSSRGIVMMLHQAQNDLRMRTIGPLSISVSKGNVFEYFDELRQVIECARSDLLFVDPYLDAEFVSRYLPFVAEGTAVRLLGRERIQALISATNIFSTQNRLDITVRSSLGLHDRYVIVDGSACYQSGASFKDGAKKAGTTLTQITDAFSAVRDTYEQLWSSAIEQN